MLSKTGLIACCISGLKKVPPPVWEQSLIKVNLHLEQCVNFVGWVKQLDATLKTGERFFVAHRSLYDAIPAVWKLKPQQQRQSVKFMIDGFYREFKETGGNT